MQRVPPRKEKQMNGSRKMHRRSTPAPPEVGGEGQEASASGDASPTEEAETRWGRRNVEKIDLMR